jgi:hypothetical protein
MLHFIYIFSKNISTEYFKHAAHSPFFSSKCRLFHNATFFGSCIIHILYTGCAKIEMLNSGAKRLKEHLASIFRVRYGGRIFLWQFRKHQSEYMMSQHQRWLAESFITLSVS